MVSRRSLSSTRRLRPAGDLAALALLLAIIAAAVGFRFIYDNWLSQWDILGYFLPNYAYVGERLRHFQIPAWNPYFSSGTPLAGDAEGGWMYLPAMITFALFQAATAMKLAVLLQTLIGGLATYLFARRLGLLPLAALFAAATLATGPVLYDITAQSTVVGQIALWLPVAMLGAESAIAAADWRGRLAWAGLCGVGIVQMFAAWPQGCLYGAMMVGGWFAYRGLLPEHEPRRAQLSRAVMAGASSAIFAAMIGAAAILPRLDFNAQSTISNANYANALGGNYASQPLSWLGLFGVFLQTSYFWRITEFSSVIVLLALLAALLGRRRYAVPFFAGAILLFLDLAATTSLTRRFFDLLPYFSELHDHRPTGAMYMIDLPLAMLAGTGVQLLLTAPPARRAWLWRLLPLPILLLALGAVKHHGAPLSPRQAELAIVATAIIALAAIPLPSSLSRLQSWVPPLLAVALLGLSLLYPTGRDVLWAIHTPNDINNNLLSTNSSIEQATQAILSRRDPGAPAALMQYFQAQQPPFRYAAYFGTGSVDDPHHSSTAIQRRPSMVEILAGSRSVMLGLEQISGYNPLHLAYYAHYIDVMNGARQNYHWLDIHAAALSSQLLDMLNVRYILVSNVVKHPLDLPEGTVIYRDDLITIYENGGAFPRAWLVHEIRPDSNGAGLTQLASGAVNGHSVAFVDGPLPPLTSVRPLTTSSQDLTDTVDVTALHPETLRLRVTASSPGLLVVSQPYAKGWMATIDGHSAPVLRTDYALQGIPLPAGEHTVVLTYAPRSLTIGLWLTGAGLLALIAVWGWAIIGGKSHDRGPVVDSIPAG